MRYFLKKHWFWLLFGTIFVLYAAFLALIFFAPRVDLKERGFVSCTKQMVRQLHHCQKSKALCTVKVMIKNNACDFKVVRQGFTKWINGEQKTPWANYYFEPLLKEEAEQNDEELKAYYEEHLNLFSEMEELNKKRIELEKQTNQINSQAPTGMIEESDGTLTQEKKNEQNK